MASEPRLTLDDVLASAARLQAIVPDAVLVGGSAAAFHARHRLSTDHDHVVRDLGDRFDTILTNLEALGDWSTARAQPGRIILGSLGGIESGIRQLRRTRALEVETVAIGDLTLTVPTVEETLRIKAWLAVTRNQVRDYLDIAALTDHLGVSGSAQALGSMDEYYADIYEGEDRVASQLVRQLADPEPRDRHTIDDLARYKDLDPRWQSWDDVTALTRALALELLELDR